MLTPNVAGKAARRRCLGAWLRWSFAYLGLHSRPISDDFCHLGAALQLNLLDYLLYWRGTVVASFSDKAIFYALGPLGLDAVKLFPALLLASWALGAAGLVDAYLAIPEYHAPSPANCAVAGGAAGNAAVANGLYYQTALFWFSATAKYSAPLVLLTPFPLLLLHAASRPLSRPRLAFIQLAGGVWCFLLAGFSETFAIVLLIGLIVAMRAILIAAHGRSRSHCVQILAAGILGVAACAAIMVTAPAIGNRLASEQNWNAQVMQQMPLEVLTGAGQILLDRIISSEAFAGFAMLLAAGVFVSLFAYDPPGGRASAAFQLRRNPLVFCLLVQLLLLPLLWTHQSDVAAIFGRFSPAYAVVVGINLFLACLLALILRRREQVNLLLQQRERLAFSGALAIMLLLFALTQFRSIHWRAYIYLYISCHSLLFATAALAAGQLRIRKARALIAIICTLHVITWIAAVAVALILSMISGRDIMRTFTFAAYLNAWLGLVWGLYLGFTLRSIGDDTSRRFRSAMQVSAALVVVTILGGIVVAQLKLVPSLQRFAREFDARHAEILRLRQAGERRIIVPPYSFDLERHLQVIPMDGHRCPLEYYDVDIINLTTQ